MIVDYFPLILDISNEYVGKRRMGISRDESIAMILEENESIMVDTDDGAQVWIGLAKALSSKHELTTYVLSNASEGIDKLCLLFPEASKSLISSKASICDPAKIGPEAKYSRKKEYIPDWKIGDTFIHVLKGDLPLSLGLDGDYSVLRKTDDWYDNYNDTHYQVVLLSVCRKDKIPRSVDELEQLGFIPFQKYVFKGVCKGYDYKGYIGINSKRKESSYELIRVGNYADARGPKDEYVNEYGDIGARWFLYPRIGAATYDDITLRTCWGYRNFGIQNI